MNNKKKLRLKFLAIILLALASGVLAYPKFVEKIPFLFDIANTHKLNLGLDLQGGVHLEYRADTSKIDPSRLAEAMQGAQAIVERRVNAFGVGEPLVYSTKSGNERRIVVELPGIKDIEEAKKRIKDAPLLEFKEEADQLDPQIQGMFDSLNEQAKKQAQDVLDQLKKGGDFEAIAKEKSQDPGSKEKGGDLGFVKRGQFVPEFDNILFDSNLKPGELYPYLVESQYGWHIIKFLESKGDGDNKEVRAEHILFAKQDPSQYPEFQYKLTGLTGKNLKNAAAEFSGQGVGEPQVLLQFDDEGTTLFAELTRRNLGKRIAIFLDNELQVAPTVQSEIVNGSAVITGGYTIDQAKEIAQRLNEGALPVPLTLISSQSIEATLGADSLDKIIFAGLLGFVAVVVFMLVVYRFFGLIASIALLIYTGLMIAIFKLTGITLTLSGIAGFVLSIGMAVDANILIFERTKEEIRNGRTIYNALIEGFKRAWTSIRDGNVSSLLTAGILYFMGTGFVKGFAAALFIGVAVSMFTAVVISRTLLNFIIGDWIKERYWLVGINQKSKIKMENDNVK